MNRKLFSHSILSILFNSLFILFGLTLLLSTPTLQASPVAWDKEGEVWQKQASKHFTISYLSQHQAYAERVLIIAETVQKQLFPFYQTTPKNKTRIILLDDSDIVIKVTDTLEYGEIRLQMTPSTEITEIESEDDWIHLSLSNKYSQILHFELATGTFRDIVLAAEFTPSMLIKGMALYLQNSNDLQSNLLNSSTTTMKMRIEVEANRLRELNKIVVKTREWPYDAMYIYGVYFIDYLVKKYGEEKLLAFLTHYSQNLTSYVFLNKQTEDYFDKDFYSLWAEFQASLITEFTPKIEALKSNEVTGELIGKTQFLLPVSAGKAGLLLGFANGQDRHTIQQYSDDKWEEITPVNRVNSFDNHAQQGLLLTRSIAYADKHTFNDIFIFNDYQWRRVTEKQRFKYVRWMKDGQHFIGSRVVEGLSELWLFDLKKEKEPIRLWQGQKNEIIGDFDVAPNGKYLVASLKRPLQSWKIERFNFKDKNWQKMTNHHGAETTPSFTPNGDVLYSADYDGVYNIYRFDTQKKTIGQLTSLVGGAFRPVWQQGLGLVFQSYESSGYTLRHIKDPQVIKLVNNPQKRKDRKVRSPYDTTIEISEPEPYSTWETMQSHSMYPLLFADEVRTLVGLNTYGADALGRHNYDIYAFWDVVNEQASYVFQYQYDNRWTFAYTQDYNFDNLTPEAEMANYEISKSQVYLLQRNNIFNAWEDKLGFHSGVTYSLDEVISTPDVITAQPASTESVNTEELTLGLAFTYDNREYYLNVPGTGWGHYFDFTYEQNIVGIDFSGQKYQTQWHFTFDLPKRFTLMTRLAAGYSTDEAKRFSLGGNNLSEEMRLFDRNQQSIRGYDDLAQLGHIYATQRIELNALLGRFEQNFGLFPLGMGDIAGKVFIDSGAAWDRGETPENLTGVGAQVQVEFKLGYNYTLPITLGYAYGLDAVKGKDYLYMNFGSSY